MSKELERPLWDDVTKASPHGSHLKSTRKNEKNTLLSENILGEVGGGRRVDIKPPRLACSENSPRRKRRAKSQYRCRSANFTCVSAPP